MARQQPLSAAADVSFSRLGAEQSGEASSRAGSRGSGSRGEEERGVGEEERVVGDDDNTSSPNSRRAVGHRSRHSGGFLLESPATNGYARGNGDRDRHGKRKAQEGSLRVDKRRLPQAQGRYSADMSYGSSPLSREVSMDGAAEEEEGPRPTGRAQSMDPAQLVQMALSLSESRRRHVSGPLQVPLASPRGARVASGLSAGFGTTERARSPRTKRLSHLSSGTEGDHSRQETPEYEQAALEDDGIRNEDTNGSPTIFTFSPATLSRAEKARKYFELASEHRRLLQYLPPLKPDANAPGNYTFASANSPGSTQPAISRISSNVNNKHQLGRQYNPMQALRNRRLRTRERRPMTAPPEVWAETEQVKSWVDEVGTATGQTQYRRDQDRVNLPAFDGDVGGAVVVQESPKGHRRTDTAGSVITRRENGWSIEPTELLGDTYWTEMGDNKSLIENRRGARVFPGLEVSEKRARKSAEIVRENGDADARERKPDHQHSHPRRQLLPHKPHRRLPKLSRSVSSSSDGSAHNGSLLGFGSEPGEENIGPLQRHMQEMIAKEERGELSSPELMSPDHWDSQHAAYPTFNGNGQRDSNNRAKGRLTVDTQLQHRRSKSADARFEAGVNALSSDDHIASLPNSPKLRTLLPAIDTDPSPPANNKKKSKLHRLPLFRSHSKERNNIEHADFAAATPTVVVDEEKQPRSSLDSLRIPQMQRNKTQESYSSSLRRFNTAATSATGTEGSVKDSSGSGVGRFFKGGRMADIVRNESSKFGGRLRGRDRGDADERTAALSPEEYEEISPQEVGEGGRGRPMFNLPSFTSPAGRQLDSQRGKSVDHDQGPLFRHPDGEQQPSRPAPPQLNLPDDDNTNIAPDHSDDRRKSYGSLDTSPDARRSSQFVAHARRHWSISDKKQGPPEPEASKAVSWRDVARVRALLLSSGIKAREIQRRADAPRKEALPLTIKAAETAGKELRRDVPLKHEYIVVAQMLSQALDNTTAQLQEAVTHFQKDTATSLVQQTEQIERKAAEQLAHRVHDTSDDADSFNVELTTRQPQDIKRVDDTIDAMLRRRRRQFRLLRRAGFKLLEWVVLGVMWWVWFVVVLWHSARRALLGVLALVRWLISF